MHSHLVRLVTIFATLTSALFGATWQLKPEDAVILLSDNGSVVHAFAAKELQKHLGLICGVEIPIRARQDDARHAFYINAWPPASTFPSLLRKAAGGSTSPASGCAARTARERPSRPARSSRSGPPPGIVALAP